jgi:hypothetical protein
MLEEGCSCVSLYVYCYSASCILFPLNLAETPGSKRTKFTVAKD